MMCSLCNRSIKSYDPRFHHLVIDDASSVDICPDCIDKFIIWQGSIIRNIFPTNTLKKRSGSK